MTELKNDRTASRMTRGLTALAAMSLAAILAWSVLTLPPYPERTRSLVFENMESSGVENPVTAVLLNFRGYDTLIEIGVLLLALVGLGGTAVEVLLAGERPGVVVPQTALIDDGGVPVVYLQTGGESFVRAEVRVLTRQSGQVLVEGLPGGMRLVVRGGNAVRRETLVSRDVGARHAH